MSAILLYGLWNLYHLTPIMCRVFFAASFRGLPQALAGMAQWLGRRSFAGGLSLIYA